MLVFFWIESNQILYSQWNILRPKRILLVNIYNQNLLQRDTLTKNKIAKHTYGVYEISNRRTFVFFLV